MARWLTLRFHSPLIEPDRRISRIRLSDKARHEKAKTPIWELGAEFGAYLRRADRGSVLRKRGKRGQEPISDGRGKGGKGVKGKKGSGADRMKGKKGSGADRMAPDSFPHVDPFPVPSDPDFPTRGLDVWSREKAVVITRVVGPGWSSSGADGLSRRNGPCRPWLWRSRDRWRSRERWGRAGRRRLRCRSRRASRPGRCLST